MASTSRTRSKQRTSTSRTRSKSRSRSQSRSRSRSRGRPSKRKSTKIEQTKTEKTKRETTSSSRSSPSRKVKTSTPPPRTTPTRQSARLAQKVPTDSEEPKKQVPEQKVEEEEVSCQPATKAGYQFGGPIGAFIITLLMPVALLAANQICNKESCELRLPTMPASLAVMFNYQAFLVYLGWVAFQAVLFCLPVGKRVKFSKGSGNEGGVHYCNGIFSLVATVAVASGLIYEGYSVQFVIKNFTRLTVSSIIFAFLFSAVLYIRALSRKESSRNPSGNSGCLTYDLFVGAELNPVFGRLHVKLFLIRLTSLTYLALNYVYMYEAYTSDKLSNNLAVVTVLQTIYVLDTLYFEAGLFKTMMMSNDGTGFLLTLVFCAWFPFLFCAPTRYLFYFPQSSNYLTCAAYVLLFAFGYLVCRGSNSQKEKFRTDPHNPIFAGLETIPTSSGKRLLAAGWWGLVRHPNYLGDIIINLAITLPCGFTLTVPWLTMAFMLLSMMDRAATDNALCSMKYGPAWTRYCQRVPHMIIPKIY